MAQAVGERQPRLDVDLDWLACRCGCSRCRNSSARYAPQQPRYVGEALAMVLADDADARAAYKASSERA